MKKSLQKKCKIFFSSILFNLTIMPLTLAFEGNNGEPTLAEEIQRNQYVSEIIGWLLFIAGFTCVGKCIHIGILYLTAGPAERARASKAMLPWLVGAVVSFGFIFIANTLINILGGNYLSAPLSGY